MENKQTTDGGSNTNFKCVHCGNGSLVRSNFKFSTNHKAYCKKNDKCCAAWLKEQIKYHHEMAEAGRI